MRTRQQCKTSKQPSITSSKIVKNDPKKINRKKRGRPKKRGKSQSMEEEKVPSPPVEVQNIERRKIIDPRNNIEPRKNVESRKTVGPRKNIEPRKSTGPRKSIEPRKTVEPRKRGRPSKITNQQINTDIDFINCDLVPQEPEIEIIDSVIPLSPLKYQTAQSDLLLDLKRKEEEMIDSVISLSPLKSDTAPSDLLLHFEKEEEEIIDSILLNPLKSETAQRDPLLELEKVSVICGNDNPSDDDDCFDNDVFDDYSHASEDESPGTYQEEQTFEEMTNEINIEISEPAQSNCFNLDCGAKTREVIGNVNLSSDLDAMCYTNILKAIEVMLDNKVNSFGLRISEDSVIGSMITDIVQDSMSNTAKLEVLKKIAYGIILFEKVKNKDPKILSLEDCFIPAKLYILLDTIKEVCTHFEQLEGYESPVEALSWFFHSAGSKVTNNAINKIECEEKKTVTLSNINIVLEVIKSNWSDLSLFKSNKTTTTLGVKDTLSPMVVDSSETVLNFNNLTSCSFENTTGQNTTGRGEPNNTLIPTKSPQDKLTPKKTANKNQLTSSCGENSSKKQYVMKRHYCLYCKKVVSNFSRHALNLHKNEKEISEIIELRKNGDKESIKERHLRMREVMLRGNYLHDSKILSETITEGSDLPASHLLRNCKRFTSGPKKLQDLTMCPYCKGFYSKKHFGSHDRNCYSRNKYKSNSISNNHEKKSIKTNVLQGGKMCKRHCVFCGLYISRFVFYKHLMTEHRDEEPTIQYIALMKENSEDNINKRKEILNSLQLKCNDGRLSRRAKNVSSVIISENPSTVPPNTSQGFLQNKDDKPIENVVITVDPMNPCKCSKSIKSVNKKDTTNKKKSSLIRGHRFRNFHGVELGSKSRICVTNDNFTLRLKKDPVIKEALDDSLIKSIIYKYQTNIKHKQIKNNKNKYYENSIFKKLKLGCNFFMKLKKKDHSIFQLYDCLTSPKKEVVFETIKDMCEFNETTETIGVLSMPCRLSAFIRDAIERALRDLEFNKATNTTSREAAMQGTEDILRFLSKLDVLSKSSRPTEVKKSSKVKYIKNKNKETVEMDYKALSALTQSIDDNTENISDLIDNDKKSQNPQISIPGDGSPGCAYSYEDSILGKCTTETNVSLDFEQLHGLQANCLYPKVVNPTHESIKSIKNTTNTENSNEEYGNFEQSLIGKDNFKLSTSFEDKKENSPSSTQLNSELIETETILKQQFIPPKIINTDEDYRCKHPKKPKTQEKRKYFCPYCKKLVKEFSRHLKDVHKNEKEVIKITDLAKNKDRESVKVKLWLMKELRLRGNHDQNILSVSATQGLDVPSSHLTYNCRKFKLGPKALKDLVMCTFCKDIYPKRNFYRHLKICYPKNKYERSLLQKNPKKPFISTLKAKSNLRRGYSLFFKKVFHRHFRLGLSRNKNQHNLPVSSKDLKHTYDEQCQLTKSNIVRARHYCLFCGKIVLNFIKHILKRHHGKKTIIEYMALMNGNTEDSITKGRKILRMLHLKSNNVYLSKLTQKKLPEKCSVEPINEIGLQIGQTTQVSESIGSAPESKEDKNMQDGLQSSLKRLKEKVTVKNHDHIPHPRSAAKCYGISLININPPIPPPHASSKFIQLVLPKLKRDDISRIALNDPLLVATASSILERMLNESKFTGVKCASTFLRDGGSLLKCAMSIDNTIKEFHDLLKPSKINTVFETAKEMCGLDEKTGKIKFTKKPFRIIFVINKTTAQALTDVSNNTSMSENDKMQIKKDINEFLDLKRIKFRSLITQWPGSKKLRESSETSNFSNIKRKSKKRKIYSSSESEEYTSDESEEDNEVTPQNTRTITKKEKHFEHNSLSEKREHSSHLKKKWTELQKRIVIMEFKDFIKNGTNPGRKRCRELIASNDELVGRTADQVNLIIDNINKGKLKLPYEFKYLKN
ncbi:uncharacterized protein LOC128998060 isoform X2 [Macrosteles quadrilineatus]|uniref:uncharacterized protein LOC128998060 isoform X2 n=1 Tax=Macrosteles quadrilineatus TaxID=74068 RepID=UPI0023E1F006|nr:uncharacterized protein LOC128998060 isoform X2 [Macrosteles quadrilineatus]